MSDELDSLIDRLRGGIRKSPLGLEAADALVTLRARLQEAEKDAARYRWLRNLIDWYPSGWNGNPNGRHDLLWTNPNSNLDEAIDAAISGSDSTEGA